MTDLANAIALRGAAAEDRNAAARLFRACERCFDRFFGERANPLRQLGALGFWFFWAAVASGIYIYAFFDTSVAGAYEALARTARAPWSPNAVVRSVHRYAADGFILVAALHLARELAFGRFRGFRWFSWLTGVPLAWLMLAAGVVGYWLAWDALAQFTGVAVTEWFGALPGFGDALVRNFIAAEAVSDRFFSLLMFLHIGLSLLLLLGMWVHIQRITRARTRPAAALGWGTLAMLIVLALARPVLPQAQADLAREPVSLAIDWFYLFPLALVDRLSPADVWALAAAATLFLGLLPWLGSRARAPVAVVDPANCNGCGRCFADCPYGAVLLEPRTDARGGEIARVLGDLCAGCGICAGACPSSTPFRSAAEFASGIDMPQLPVRALRARLQHALAGLPQHNGVLLFGCDCGARVAPLVSPGVAALSLPCIGMLPPSFIEYALRSGAAGVMVSSCGEDCEFRLGAEWTEARLAAAREPHLRASVPRERVRIVAGTDAARLRRELGGFQAALAKLRGHIHALPPKSQREGTHG